MKLLVLVLASVATASSRSLPEVYQFSVDDARVRRDAVSYRTNVVHQNPNHPDQHAESSITVDFHTNKQSSESSFKKPKITSDHSQQNIAQNRPERTHIFDSPNSQAFNVGYSVRFKGPSQETPSRPTPSHSNDEIITGSQKESVQNPFLNFESQDYVSNALKGVKKSKVSGIKPYYNKYDNKNEDSKRFITHLAPKTQEYLSYLDESKFTSPSHTRLKQQIQPTTESFTSWTSVSPTVEIYRSKELASSVQTENVKHFDHKGALGQSQGFSYTDILGESNTNNNQYEPFEQKGLRIIETPDLAPSFKTVQVSPITNLQVTEKPPQVENLRKPNLPVDTSLLRNPILTVGSNKPPSDPNTLTIPFDTTLIRAMQQNLISSAAQMGGKNLNQGRQLLQGHGAQFQQQIPVFAHPGNFDQYFHSYLDNMQPQESFTNAIAIQMHPSYYNSRINAARDIEMDLRPPPLQANRRRRMFIY